MDRDKQRLETDVTCTQKSAFETATFFLYLGAKTFSIFASILYRIKIRNVFMNLTYLIQIHI